MPPCAIHPGAARRDPARIDPPAGPLQLPPSASACQSVGRARPPGRARMAGERGRGSRPGPTPGSSPVVSARVAPGKTRPPRASSRSRPARARLPPTLRPPAAATTAGASPPSRGGPLPSLVAEADRPALSSETHSRVLAAMPADGFEAASSEQTEAPAHRGPGEPRSGGGGRPRATPRRSHRSARTPLRLAAVVDPPSPARRPPSPTRARHHPARGVGRAGRRCHPSSAASSPHRRQARTRTPSRARSPRAPRRASRAPADRFHIGRPSSAPLAATTSPRPGSHRPDGGDGGQADRRRGLRHRLRRRLRPRARSTPRGPRGRPRRPAARRGPALRRRRPSRRPLRAARRPGR